MTQIFADRYKVVEKLGSGSYGDVYRVIDTADSQQPAYAVKWLRPTAPKEAVARFQNEVWALQQIDHPSIPRFVESGILDGREFLVMTLARGTSLRKVHVRQCDERGACGLMKALVIIESVLDALVYMHKIGIHHRDVKDDNILASDSGSEVYLVDLGFCRGPGQPSEHQTFWNAGASRYAPPSKLHHPGSTHPTHDVFAVGVVAYLLLTNQYPWDIGEGADRGVLEEKCGAGNRRQYTQSTASYQRTYLPFSCASS